MQASNFGKIRRTSDSFENSSVIQRKIWQFYRTVILRKTHINAAPNDSRLVSVASPGKALLIAIPSPRRVVMPAGAAVSGL